jgi:hypothetical protein
MRTSWHLSPRFLLGAGARVARASQTSKPSLGPVGRQSPDLLAAPCARSHRRATQWSLCSPAGDAWLRWAWPQQHAGLSSQSEQRVSGSRGARTPLPLYSRGPVPGRAGLPGLPARPSGPRGRQSPGLPTASYARTHRRTRPRSRHCRAGWFLAPERAAAPWRGLLTIVGLAVGRPLQQQLLQQFPRHSFQK